MTNHEQQSAAGAKLEHAGHQDQHQMMASEGGSQQQQQNFVGDDATLSSEKANCCFACRAPIKDRFIFNVINQGNFHQQCVRCADCLMGLDERCYTFAGKLYCRHDYWRRFGPKCSACQEPIKPNELVQRPKQELIYHLNCFVCLHCKRPLQAGEQLHLLDERRLLCQRDYLNHQQPAKGQVKCDSNGNSSKRAGSAAHSLSNQENQQLSATSAPTHDASHFKLQLNSSSSALSERELFATDQSDSKQEPLEEEEEEEELEGDELEDEQEANSPDEDSKGAALGMTTAPAYAGQRQRSLNNVDLGAQAANANAGQQQRLKAQQEREDCPDDLIDANGKRRGPRTTIKPKQLETLRRAFETAPKPSRHTREQLANETGLNMRVIQVWFQNRRSKERRMRNSNGSARRNFFRSSTRRLRVGPTAVNTPPPTPSTGAGAGAALNPMSALSSAGSGAGPNSAGSQQSLIAQGAAGPDESQVAGGRPGGRKQTAKQAAARQQASLSPTIEPNGGPAQKNCSSPADYANNNGAFAYFSDSSNQGDAFGQAPANGLAQHSPTSGEPTLMRLDSPSSRSAYAAGPAMQKAGASSALYQTNGLAPPPPPSSGQHMMHAQTPRMMQHQQLQPQHHHLHHMSPVHHHHHHQMMPAGAALPSQLGAAGGSAGLMHHSQTAGPPPSVMQW